MTGSSLKTLLVGRHGQLAWELQRFLPKLGSVIVMGRPEIDLANPDSLREIIRQLEPTVVVNAAAYTAVDQAEAERAVAWPVHADARRVTAEEAERLDGLFINFSSDYVFDGAKLSPYTESDVPNPLSTYGAGKLAGDRAVEALAGAYLVFRTSWVYGARGKNFLCTILRLAAEQDELRVVADQIGAPTWSRDIAHATFQILEQLAAELPSSGTALVSEVLRDRRGAYNMTSEGSTSWVGFATAILEEMRRGGMNEGRLATIVPISTEGYPAAARRPRNSRLSNEKLRHTFGITLPDWRASLAKVIEEVSEQRTTAMQNTP